MPSETQREEIEDYDHFPLYTSDNDIPGVQITQPQDVQHAPYNEGSFEGTIDPPSDPIPNDSSEGYNDVEDDINHRDEGQADQLFYPRRIT